MKGEPGMMAEDRAAAIRAYYDEMTPIILETFGHTYQGALLTEYDDDAFQSTNLFLAHRAGIKPGMRVLDAGCGAGGSAVDIARHVEDLTIEAITVSPVQAAAARDHIRAHRLTDRVHAHVGDYHRLPFPDGSFDVAYFFESACYSTDHPALFRETLRVLRPGGLLYVKDLFAKPELTGIEAEALAEINRSWRTSIGPLAGTTAAVQAAGFTELRYRIEQLYDSEPFKQAMAKFQDGDPVLTSSGDLQLTDFGRAHQPMLWLKGVSPGIVAEIWAIRPDGD